MKITYAKVDLAASGDIVAAAAGKKYRLLALYAISASAVNLTLRSNTTALSVIPSFTNPNNLSIATGRAWGLYVSTGRGDTSIGIEEPALFTEPGLFLVRPDGTLYWAAVQTMPFARPGFADVLKALDFVIAKDYPARGEA